MQAAAIAALGRYENPAIATNLFLRWPELSLALRRQVISALLTRTDRVPEVLTALENGTISPGDLSPIHVNFLRTYHEPALSRRALQIFGPLARSRPAILEQFKESLRSPGVAARGREIFLARCDSCHSFGRENLRLGPDLSAARLKRKEKLLSDILEPNAEILPAYATYVLESRRGENLPGIVREENSTAVTLRQPDGAELVWPRLNIQSLQAQPWSLMPEGLEQGLTAAGMADLLEYLTSFTPDGLR